MQVNEHPVEQEEVMAYLDGELSSDRAAIVEAHLQDCGDCQGLAAEVRDVSRQLAKWPVETTPAWLPGKIASALRTGRSVRKWAWWAGITAGIATACLLIILLVPPKLPSPVELTTMSNSLSHGPKVLRRSEPVSMGKLPQMGSYNPAEAVVRSASPRGAARPMLARNSQLDVITKEFDKSRGALEDILKRHRGYLGGLNITAFTGSRTLNATLMLPSDQLDSATGEIKELGQVESESQATEEVTQQYSDLDARLTNARNTEQRLNALLRERTAKMADVLAVEKEVDRVRGEIEQMEREKKALAKRVDFATLSVTLREAAKAQLPSLSTRERFQNAAADGYTTLADAAIAVAVFLLAYGPSLLLWGGLALLGLRFAFSKLRAATDR